ncbi:hypothetical protein CRN15_20035 [Raoultella planticola]|nr:hypothetical protein CRT62_14800 [Raoultella planticola]ATM16986.1 hypothetical protein CRN15_20035 [Raoultella planticola]PHH23066.1 hypothetical protein CRX55_02895 [Raoultella planticola]
MYSFLRMELRLAVVFHRLIILQINKIRHCNDAEDKMEAYYIGFHFAGMAGDQHLIRANTLPASRLDSAVVKATTCLLM